jgi:hypothetical protein
MSKKGKLVSFFAIKAYRGVEVEFHSFLTLALDEEKCSIIFPDGLSPQEKIDTH